MRKQRALVQELPIFRAIHKHYITLLSLLSSHLTQ